MTPNSAIERSLHRFGFLLTLGGCAVAGNGLILLGLDRHLFTISASMRLWPLYFTFVLITFGLAWMIVNASREGAFNVKMDPELASVHVGLPVLVAAGAAYLSGSWPVTMELLMGICLIGFGLRSMRARLGD